MPRNRVEKYQRYLSSAIDRINDKLELARAHPEEHHRLGEASSIGCYTLEWLGNDPDFLRDIRLLATLKEENLDDMKEIVSDFSDFERFLRIEREILLQAGLRSNTAMWLIDLCRSLRGEVVDDFFPPNSTEQLIETISNRISKLREQACHMADVQVKRAEQAIVYKRLLMGMGGALLVGLNVGTVATTIGLTAPAAALSGAFGVAIITTTVDTYR